MNKMYMTTLKVTALILTFVLGMLSSLAILIGGAIFAANKVSLNALEKVGVNVDTSELFDDNADKPIRDMSLLKLIEEFNYVSSINDTASLDYISENYGLVLPPKGESVFFDAVRTTPLGLLFAPEGIDLIMSSLLLGNVVGYEQKDNPKYDPNVPDSGENEKIWFNPNKGEFVYGVEAIVCDYTLYKLVNEGIDVPMILEEVPVGEIFGYKEVSEGVWKDSNDEQITGIMAIIADKTLNNLEGSLDNEPMGHLLGYTYVIDEENGTEGYWINPKNEEDNTVKPFMQLVADTKFSELDTIDEKVTIADLIPEEQRQSGYISLVDPNVHLDDVSTEVNRVFAESTLQELVDCGALELSDDEAAALESKPFLKEMNLNQLISFVLLN